MKIVSLFIFIIIFSFTVFSQTAKTAKIDFNAFEDEKTGIKELVDILKKLNEEFQPEVDKLNELVKKRQKILEEAKDLSAKSLSGFYCGPDNLKDTIEEKFKSFELLNNQINDLDEKLKVAYDNRKAQLTQPINKRINEKLKIFIKQKGYTTVFDISKDISSYTIIENFESLPNITKEFIEFCNTEFEKEKGQNLK